MLNFEINKIYNEDCRTTMKKMPNNIVDVILTSPFYNTNKKQGNNLTLMNSKFGKNIYPSVRYDMHVDNLSDEEYCDFTKNLFLNFDKILNKNGVVLYNLSYGNENRDGMYKAIYSIITETPFTIADVICWKKKSALPNNVSSNKLTRIWEQVFVFCRKDEVETFNCNKTVTSISRVGQKYYNNIFNYIEAKNNDGACPYNKATYSTDLCKQLLNIYCPSNGVVFDPFMGSGTTAAACKELGISYIGSELSERQCNWASERLEKITPIEKV